MHSHYSHHILIHDPFLIHPEQIHRKPTDVLQLGGGRGQSTSSLHHSQHVHYLAVSSSAVLLCLLSNIHRCLSQTVLFSVQTDREKLKITLFSIPIPNPNPRTDNSLRRN